MGSGTKEKETKKKDTRDNYNRWRYAEGERGQKKEPKTQTFINREIERPKDKTNN
jgi:hypothetical protein